MPSTCGETLVGARRYRNRHHPLRAAAPARFQPSWSDRDHNSNLWSLPATVIGQSTGLQLFHRLELVLRGHLSSGDFGASPLVLCWRWPATSRVETRGGHLVRTMRFARMSLEGPDWNNHSSPERTIQNGLLLGAA